MHLGNRKRITFSNQAIELPSLDMFMCSLNADKDPIPLKKIFFNLDLVNAKIISLIHSMLKRISISIERTLFFPFFKFVQVRV